MRMTMGASKYTKMITAGVITRLHTIPLAMLPIKCHPRIRRIPHRNATTEHQTMKARNMSVQRDQDWWRHTGGQFACVAGGRPSPLGAMPAFLYSCVPQASAGSSREGRQVFRSMKEEADRGPAHQIAWRERHQKPLR